MSESDVSDHFEITSRILTLKIVHKKNLRPFRNHINVYQKKMWCTMLMNFCLAVKKVLKVNEFGRENVHLANLVMKKRFTKFINWW